MALSKNRGSLSRIDSDNSNFYQESHTSLASLEFRVCCEYYEESINYPPNYHIKLDIFEKKKFQYSLFFDTEDGQGQNRACLEFLLYLVSTN